MDPQIVIVGAGLFGLTIAERCADRGQRVLIVDQRAAIGGNARSTVDQITGIESHDYGSHLFHTSNERVWQYVNRFTQFNEYKHRVFTQYKGSVYPLPVNLFTINQIYGRTMGPEEARRFLQQEIDKEGIDRPQDLEHKAVGSIGRRLYEALVKGYTEKQWQTPATDLPADIISRLPVRYNYNQNYFDDKYEGLPLNGYSTWFDRMVANPKIEVRLNCDFLDKKAPINRWSVVGQCPVIFSGPIDRFFDYKYGPLTWRTLDFEKVTYDSCDFQGTAVMNYADLDVPYTRVHEFRHLHPERHYSSERTVVMYERSRFANEFDEPYYPVGSAKDRAKLEAYRKDAHDSAVTFGGRLGSYKYLDMHMAIASALTLAEQL